MKFYPCLKPFRIYDSGHYIICDCGLCKNCKKNIYTINNKCISSKPKIIRNIIYLFKKLIPKRFQKKSYQNLIKKAINNNKELTRSTFSMEDIRYACKSQK